MFLIKESVKLCLKPVKMKKNRIKPEHEKLEKIKTY